MQATRFPSSRRRRSRLAAGGACAAGRNATRRVGILMSTAETDPLEISEPHSVYSGTGETRMDPGQEPGSERALGSRRRTTDDGQCRGIGVTPDRSHSGQGSHRPFGPSRRRQQYLSCLSAFPTRSSSRWSAAFRSPSAISRASRPTNTGLSANGSACCETCPRRPAACCIFEAAESGVATQSLAGTRDGRCASRQFQRDRRPRPERCRRRQRDTGIRRRRSERRFARCLRRLHADTSRGNRGNGSRVFDCPRFILRATSPEKAACAVTASIKTSNSARRRYVSRLLSGAKPTDCRCRHRQDLNYGSPRTAKALIRALRSTCLHRPTGRSITAQSGRNPLLPRPTSVPRIRGRAQRPIAVTMPRSTN